eukprot:s710_g15.t1
MLKPPTRSNSKQFASHPSNHFVRWMKSFKRAPHAAPLQDIWGKKYLPLGLIFIGCATAGHVPEVLSSAFECGSRNALSHWPSNCRR